MPSATVMAAEEPPVSDATSSYWPLLAAITVSSVAVALVFYAPTIRTMVRTWQFGSYSHGYLILPISLLLIWSLRDRVRTAAPRPNYWVLPLLACLSFCWLVAHVVNVNTVQQFAVVALIPLAIWAILGDEVLRILAFPLCFLVFAVPLGESFTGPLQDFTAAFLVRALQFSGIPAVLDGRMLTVPGGNWEVAEACSGLRYLVSTFTLGVLFAAMVFRTWRRRILFSALCLVTPIIANGIRAYGIVLLAYLTDRRVAVGVDHLIYGWVFFVLVICCLFFFGYRLREKDEAPQEAQLQSRAPGHSLRPLPLRNFALAGVLTLVACSAGPLYAFLSPAGRAKAQPRFLNPVIDSAWVPSTEHDDWMPLFQGTDEDLRSEYRTGDARVQLYVGYYATGESAARLVSSTNRILGTKWRFLNERLRSQVIDGLSMQILETEAAYNNSRHIVWSWYWIDGQVTANPYYAKYLQAKNRLLRRQGAAAVVALEAPYTVSAEEARASLAALLQHTRLSPTKAE